MPPSSNMRKSTAGSMTMVEPQSNGTFAAVTNSSLQPRRTNSGRLIRVNTTRPANYYARPFGSIAVSTDNDPALLDSDALQPPGFFPAIQFFADAITALPKEVMKQFTLMKEVEAKIHGPTEQLSDLIDQLMQQPVPTRKHAANVSAGGGAGQGLLSLTGNNSNVGSANASLVNGVAGQFSARNSVNGSLNGDEVHDSAEERARRAKYHELRAVTRSLLANLDEKNVVLAEANRVLGLQELRLDSVMPHVDNEISEEARLGSMTHWAYSDNRQKKPTANQAVANRRDLVAANSLAAAANAMRENDIQEARARAGREAAREKTKGKRTEHAGDSDFDEKPPRKMPKTSKGKAAAMAVASSTSVTGLGIIANGEINTKRKKPAADKGGLAAVMMERSGSGSGKGAKTIKDTPRSAPNLDASAKRGPKAKPALPPPKKKLPNSAQASPMMASSPLVATFTPTTVDLPNPRPSSARLRQNSNATSLRHEKVPEQDSTNGPPPAVPAVPPNNEEEVSIKQQKVPESVEEPEIPAVEEPVERHVKETTEKVEREDKDNPEIGHDDRLGESRSGSNSHKNSGRTSKVGTPRTDSLPALESSTVRIRTTRSKPGGRGEGRDSSSVEPQLQGVGSMKHRRNVSNSHLVKQLAPFNRSPDLDRHKSRDDMDDDVESLEEKAPLVTEESDFKDKDDVDKGTEEESREVRRASTRRPTSRRNTANAAPSSPIPVPPKLASPPASPPPITRQRITREPEPMPLPEPAEEDDDEESEHDPDDPDEPKYCYCNRGSYGDMVACDNSECPREWFHLGCTELRAPPSADEVWYCRDCRPKFRKVRGRGIGRA